MKTKEKKKVETAVTSSLWLLCLFVMIPYCGITEVGGGGAGAGVKKRQRAGGGGKALLMLLVLFFCKRR